jgi:hypothetical protein
VKKSEVAEIVMMLIAAFPNSKITPQTSAVYEASLVDLPVDVARQAVTRLIATSEWFPTVAKIRSAVVDLRLGPVASGAEAYDLVLQAIRKHGPAFGNHPEPMFADPYIAKCLGVWGTWNGACNSPSNDPGGRARFIELYDDLASRARADVVSGVALPAPADTRKAFWLKKPRQLTSGEETVAPVLELRPVPRIKHPEPEQRRWTAEEIEQRLGIGGAP